jgi:transposase-like protein
MNTHTALAMDTALEGARRATGDAVSSAPPNPEVVATAQRRQFSSGDKQRILAAADACKEAGELGALLRREGIYSSNLTTWRKQRAAAERAALEPKKRGRKVDPSLAEARRLGQLTRENDRLRRQLAQARTIIDVQKKVCTLLGLLTDETPDGTS